MVKRKVILLGRKQVNLDKGLETIRAKDIEFITCTTLADLASALSDKAVDTVITGAGLPLETRLEAIRMIYEASDNITVHMKDFASGPQGFGAFANRVLNSD